MYPTSGPGNNGQGGNEDSIPLASPSEYYDGGPQPQQPYQGSSAPFGQDYGQSYSPGYDQGQGYNQGFPQGQGFDQGFYQAQGYNQPPSGGFEQAPMPSYDQPPQPVDPPSSPYGFAPAGAAPGQGLTAEPPKKSNAGIIIAVIVVALLAIGAAAFFLTRDDEKDSKGDSKGGGDTTSETTEGVPDLGGGGSGNLSVGGKGGDSGGESREDPLPPGSWVANKEWKVTLKSVDTDATRKILSENQFNDPPKKDHVYVMAEVEVEYLGDDPQGGMPMTRIEFVTPDGNTIASYDTAVVVPNEFYGIETLYKGGKSGGNVAFEVPSADVEKGTIAITPGGFSLDNGKRFFSVK